MSRYHRHEKPNRYRHNRVIEKLEKIVAKATKPWVPVMERKRKGGRV